MSELLNAVRRYELESVHALFAQGAAVAEIGGGNGYQASIIAGWGCIVQSFDLAGRPPPPRSFHQVADYDGADCLCRMQAWTLCFHRMFSSPFASFRHCSMKRCT